MIGASVFLSLTLNSSDDFFLPARACLTFLVGISALLKLLLRLPSLFSTHSERVFENLVVPAPAGALEVWLGQVGHVSSVAIPEAKAGLHPPGVRP